MTTAAPTTDPLAPVTLEGGIVRLVPLTLEHVPVLLEAALVDRAHYQWSPIPGDEAGMRAYVAKAIELCEQREALPFATTLRESGRVVGSTRFATYEFHPWPGGSPHRPPSGVPDVVEIGWTWIAGDMQRTGVNTEAKLLMLTHAFETWGVKAVRLKTDRRNSRSWAAIERIGGRLDGVIRAHTVGADGSLRDSAYFSLLATEWPGVKARLAARLQ